MLLVDLFLDDGPEAAETNQESHETEPHAPVAAAYEAHQQDESSHCEAAALVAPFLFLGWFCLGSLPGSGLLTRSRFLPGSSFGRFLVVGPTAGPADHFSLPRLQRAMPIGAFAGAPLPSSPVRFAQVIEHGAYGALHDGEYIVISPSLLSYALTNFIISQADLFQNKVQVSNAYHNMIWNNTQLHLSQLGFNAIETSFIPDGVRDKIYRFDDDKLAYVQYLTDNNRSHQTHRLPSSCHTNFETNGDLC